MALSGGHENRGELRIHESLDDLMTDLADYIHLSQAKSKPWKVLLICHRVMDATGLEVPFG
ncbi:putative 6-phosphogluconolactonase 1 [Sesbania bispinosa]|nr:putative 6-phosphogluconolactonase 1 [Sesbania bispinosa]